MLVAPGFMLNRLSSRTWNDQVPEQDDQLFLYFITFINVRTQTHGMVLSTFEVGLFQFKYFTGSAICQHNLDNYFLRIFPRNFYIVPVDN